MSKIAVLPELSRPLAVDRVPRKGSHEHFVADTKECESLARRFSIPALHSLDARFLTVPWRGGVKVTGKVIVDLEQMSVVSLEPFRKMETYSVLRYFLLPKHLVDAVEDDADPIVDGLIDLGEIAAEALGLELDPYPRKPEEVSAEPSEKSENN